MLVAAGADEVGGEELAKKINQHMPHLELLRFANSGSEAVRQTIKIARAYTGREKIAKFVFDRHRPMTFPELVRFNLAGGETGRDAIVASA